MTTPLRVLRIRSVFVSAVATAFRERSAPTMKPPLRVLLALALLEVSISGPAFAAVLAFDENGNGSFGRGSLQADPGPGGFLPSVLTYTLPFAVTAGDVQLISPDLDATTISDLVRFNPGVGDTSTLVLYSVSTDTDAGAVLADTPRTPLIFYSNQLTLFEAGTEEFNFAIFTPGPGQPGFNASFPGQSFLLVSDGTIRAPEPSSLALFGVGLTALAGLVWRRRRRK